ncbi:MAG: ferritin family protein [Candidatus Riflebacteria bacterium]|nr:ferritin family protein [Candidatus Riflebacteria bacterium]
MDPVAPHLTEGLEQAMVAESDGYHFYMMAAENTSDEQGKSAFRALAQEELDHLQFLKTQYQALISTGKPDENARLGHRAEFSGASPIFSTALMSRVKEAHYEMSALSIAIGLELSAVQHYGKLAQESADATVKAFFAELSDWESGHYEALLRQQETLKDDYWAAGGFSPL